jgi:hypothetical protein
MKKIIAFSLMLFSLSVFAAAEPEVNKKTIKAFEFTFKEAVDVKWYAEENFDHVYFTLNNVKTRMKYDKEGNFISCLRTYFEEDLPLLIRMRLKENYAGKKVTSVAEMITNTETEFHVTVEDDKNIYLLKGDIHGSFNVDKKLRKSGS